MEKLVSVTIKYGGKNGNSEEKLILPAWWPTIWGEVSRKQLR